MAKVGTRAPIDVRLKRAHKENSQEISSFRIFSSFIQWKESGLCDASNVLGKECYLAWLKSRRCEPKNPHEAFRRAVTAHIRGNDGRRPFGEEAEKSLLVELRKKRQWSAFEGTDLLVGIKGFSSLGHHEKRALFKRPKRKGETSIFEAQRNVRNRLNLQSRKSTKRLKRERPIVTPKVEPVVVKQEPQTQVKTFAKFSKTDLKFDLESVYPNGFAKSNIVLPSDWKELDSSFHTYPSKSCAQESLECDGLDLFNPLLDEMIDLCDESLDGSELSTVFEKTRISGLLF